MVEIVMQLPDTLARRIEPMSPWMSAALELSLAGFKTPAAQTVAEIIAFLATDPSPKEVMNYHVSTRAEERLRRLLALNAGGASSADEQAELDEIERIEHILIMLKAQAQERMVEESVLLRFTEGDISSGKAARLLNISRLEFLELLHLRGIAYIDFTPDEFTEELAAVDQLEASKCPN